MGLTPGERSEQVAAQPEVSWEAIDRQEWQLWLLAVVLVLLLGVSLLSFMFPSAFWFSDERMAGAPQRAFLGFIVLLGLVLMYMVQRQVEVRRLRRRLREALMSAAETEKRALAAAFDSIPGVQQFQDSLSMEFRRASVAGDPMAVVFFDVSSPGVEEMGRVAQVFRLMMRRGEGLFRLADNAIAVILPGARTADARSFAGQAEQNVRGQLAGERITATVTCYPEGSTSLAELQAPMRGRAL
jgi:GGDEF domain-containing protein